jgi:hypothetical protein
MIVEVLGPPGAGKTSLLPATIDAIGAWSGRNCESAADALDRHLRISGIGRLLAPMLATRPRRLRVIAVDVPYGIGFAVARPRLTLTAVLGILRAPVGWGHRRTLLARWIGVGARQHFLRGRLKNDVAVFDEGLYHRSVNLFAWRRTGPRREAALAVEVRAYLRMAPAPDLAIFVDGRDEVMAATAPSRPATCSSCPIPGRCRRDRADGSPYDGGSHGMDPDHEYINAR